MNKNMKLFFFNLLILITFCGTSSIAWSKAIWVTKAGNDNNNCTNQTTDACLTIQKGISLAIAGDTVNIGRGSYIEDSSHTSYTKKCSWMDGRLASLCVAQSGTKAAPITIRAIVGDEGYVIIDSESNRVGMHTLSSDYLHIKGLTFKNNNTIGLASWGQAQNAVPDEDLLGVGLIIENNSFLNTWGAEGLNVSAIGMWGSKDWIVRNNYIDGVSAGGKSVASGIQSYGVINALIENNFITNVGYGIFWKDHFVKNEQTRGTWFESEIRYNKINANNIGVNIGIRGTGSPEAGENYIHHNIIYGMQNNGAGISSSMSGAYGISAPIRIEHNLFDGGNNDTRAISLDGNENATIVGNISTRTNIDLELITYSNTKVIRLMNSDFNIFDSSMNIIIDRYSNATQAKYFKSLAAWNAALAKDALTLGKDHPDMNSVTAAAAELLLDPTNKAYRYRPGSIAFMLMPDGSNAGPYQQGNETIGQLESSDRRPLPPTPL